MPSNNLHVGPFAAAYVGLATDSAILTPLSGLTTDACKISIAQAETFNYSLGNSLQSGPINLNISLTFLSDDPQAVRLAAGNFVSTANEDDPATYPTLTLLLVHPDETGESSFLIPVCYVEKNLSLGFDKKNPTVTPLVFHWQQVNRYNPQIFYKRTAAELGTLLGPRSPF